MNNQINLFNRGEIQHAYSKKTKAVSLRRLIDDSVTSYLNKYDRLIFEASKLKLINEYEDRGYLVSELSKLLSNIYLSLGIDFKPNASVMIVVENIIEYYSNFSLAEIKLAFDLSNIGYLDSYITDNKNSHHYGKFTIPYLTAIIKGYSNKRHEVIHSVMNYPLAINESENLKDDIEKIRKNALYIRVLQFKYKGGINAYPNEINSLYELFVSKYIIPEVSISDFDLKQIVYRIRMNEIKIKNPDMKNYMINNYRDNKDVFLYALFEKRKKAVHYALNIIVEKGIDINKLMNI